MQALWVNSPVLLTPRADIPGNLSVVLGTPDLLKMRGFVSKTIKNAARLVKAEHPLPAEEMQVLWAKLSILLITCMLEKQI